MAATTSASTKELQFDGDINTGRGQFGQVVYASPTGDIVQMPMTNFDRFYNKYILSPTLNINFTLATIGVTNTEVQPGYEMYILNSSTFTIGLIGFSAKLRSMEAIHLVAKSVGVWQKMSELPSNNAITVGTGAPVSDPTDTAGDIFVDSNTGVIYTYSGGVWTAIGGGGGVATWSAGATGLTPSVPTVGAVTLAGTVNPTHGGTGLTSYTTGDIIYASAANVLSKLAVGADGQVLTLAAGVPSWAAAAGGGVTTWSAGTTGLTPSVATSGAVTLAGTLIAANGGTGFASYAVGDLLYADTTSTLAKLADVGTGNAVISGGVGVAPSWGKIDLTTHVAGTLPVANGGTNITTYATGDILYASAANTLSKLPVGTDGQVLTLAAGLPSWATGGGGGVSTFSAGTTGLTPSTPTSGAVTLAGTLIAANGGTGFATYAVGDLLYANTTTTLAKLADVVTGNALRSGGVGVAPSWGKIGLATHVNGTLLLANGGTSAALGAVNGGTVYSTGSAMAISAAGIAGQVWTSNGAAAPSWQAAAGGGSVTTGNTQWVDAVYGNNGTALPDRFDKPYLTLSAAFAASGSGDTIVVRPGSYTLAANTTFAMAGQQFYFEKGANITINGSTINGNNVFQGLVQVAGYCNFTYNTVATETNTNTLFNCSTAGNHFIEFATLTIPTYSGGDTMYIFQNSANGNTVSFNCRNYMSIAQGIFAFVSNSTTVFNIDRISSSSPSMMITDANNNIIEWNVNQFDHTATTGRIFENDSAAQVVININNMTTATTVLLNNNRSRDVALNIKTLVSTSSNAIFSIDGGFGVFSPNPQLTINVDLLSSTGPILTNSNLANNTFINIGSIITTASTSLFTCSGGNLVLTSGVTRVGTTLLTISAGTCVVSIKTPILTGTSTIFIHNGGALTINCDNVLSNTTTSGADFISSTASGNINANLLSLARQNGSAGGGMLIRSTGSATITMTFDTITTVDNSGTFLFFNSGTGVMTLFGNNITHGNSNGVVFDSRGTTSVIRAHVAQIDVVGLVAENNFSQGVLELYVDEARSTGSYGYILGITGATSHVFKGRYVAPAGSNVIKADGGPTLRLVDCTLITDGTAAINSNTGTTNIQYQSTRMTAAPTGAVSIIGTLVDTAAFT